MCTIMTYAKSIMLYERAFSCAGLLNTTSTQPGVRLAQYVLHSDGSHYEKRGKGDPACIDDEIPFEIPESWEWCRFSSVNLGSFTGPFGSSLHKSDYVTDGIPVVNPAYIVDGRAIAGKMITAETRQRLSSYILRSGDFVIGRRGEMGRAAIISEEEDGWLCGTGCFFAHMPEGIESDYWRLLFSSPLVVNQLESSSVGTTMKNLNLDILGNTLIPLPPQREQGAICTQAQRAFQIVGEYGDLEDTRERLDAELPDRLRKSILQLAVQGKLVPQDPTDEPASALLDRIRAERAALVKSGKLKASKGGESVIYRASDGGYYEKRGKGESVCIDDEIPFEIPESWKWVRLESVTVYIQRGKSPKYSPIKKYPVVAQKCNQWSGFSLELAKFVDPSTVSSYAVERILQDGDLLWNSTGLGTLGRMAIYDSSVNDYGWAVADSHVTVIRTMAEWLDYRYAFAYFAGPSVQSVIEDKASGSTKQKELAQETVRSYLVPIPPRREQTRIAEQLSKVLPQLTNQ